MKKRDRLLFVHFGETQMRGSEKCLLTLLKNLDSSLYEIYLWSNHQALAQAAAPYVQANIVGSFHLLFGFNADQSITLSGLRQTWREAHVKARALLLQIKPNVIVSNSLGPCQWLVPASLMANIPLIAYSHSRYLPKTRVMSLAYGASHIVGVSQYTLDNFLRDGYPAGQTTRIYNGVEDLRGIAPADVSLRQQLGLGADVFVFLSVCALVELKRVDVLIDAFKTVEEKAGRPCVLVIVGDGPMRTALERQSGTSSVVFCGWREDISEVFRAADCTLLASEREAFGLVAAEANSMHVPVICAPAGGLTEVVEEGRNGWLAAATDAAAFADTMLNVMSDEALLAQAKSQSRLVFERRFSAGAMASRFTEVIETVKNEHQTRASRLGRSLRLSARVMGHRLIQALRA